MNILIIAPQASAKFGGESILPLHYFTRLSERGNNVHMLVHERTKNELKTVTGDLFSRIHFVRNKSLYKILNSIARRLPSRIADFSAFLLIDILTEIRQKKIAKTLIHEYEIQLIHVPIRVSPKSPSVLYGLNIPVIYGPLNGGMDYPPGFKNDKNRLEILYVHIARRFANLIHIFLPGKRKAQAIIVANERTFKVLPKTQCKNFFTLVENGVDIQLFNPNTQKYSNNLECSEIRFIYLGRLIYWKRVDIILLAMARLIKKYNHITLEIVGDGQERIFLEEMSHNLSLEHNITFHGKLPQEECALILSTCDCLLLPSIYECGGAVVLEAMATGRPVIATDWGGPSDYIDSSCGFLVNPGNGESDLVEGFVTSMETLIKNPDFVEKLGRQGRKKVEISYNWEKKIDKIIEIYNEIINLQT